ncbi:MAG: DUF2336 domain-containing protein [Hyphomonadaceae bacterium]
MSVLTMRAKLTDADIRALVKGAGDDERAAAAHKICHCVEHAPMSDSERAHAEAILRLMAEDTAESVRRALAVTLKNSPRLPRALAMKLADDIDSIALPILKHSPALSDEDLVAILRAAPPERQFAVATRDKLSEKVTGAVAAFADQRALEAALANDNARFDEAGLNTALQRMGDRPGVTGAMARRRELPVGVVEKLVALVTGEVFDYLVNHHEVPPQLAIDLASGARERATLDLVEQAGLQRDLERFVKQLSLHGRLTPSFIMRALCLGHVEFIEHAMGELAGLPHHRAWLMLHDSGALGLKAVFDRSGLPARLYPAFRAAIEVYHQIEREDRAFDRTDFRQRMIERVLTLFQTIPRDDLDYLLEKLDATGAARDRASA